MGKRKDGITSLARLRARCSIADRTDPDCCWIWKGATRNGVAAVWLPVGEKTRIVTAPAAAAILSGREIPKGHRTWASCCDANCCNPRHSVSGTYAEWGEHVRANGLWRGSERTRAAALARGRSRSKIDMSIAREIRASHLSNRLEAQRVKEVHGIEVSHHLVSNVRNQKRWAEPNPFAGLV